jgi:hypothetical protein
MFVLCVGFICFAIQMILAQNSVSQGYNYGNMGLSATCDFEWSMCGWTQEVTPMDQLDWRRHRGPGGTGWYKIQGDHTPGKDACTLLLSPYFEKTVQLCQICEVRKFFFSKIVNHYN